jgi:hypothetical protein
MQSESEVFTGVHKEASGHKNDLINGVSTGMKAGKILLNNGTRHDQ